jgi:TctA family transporter
VIGVYSVSNNEFGLYLLLVFSVLGFFLRRMRVEPTPMLLAFILGPMMEEYLRRALLMSGGSAATLVTHPTSAVLLLISVLLLAMVLAPTIRKKREEAFQEE